MIEMILKSSRMAQVYRSNVIAALNMKIREDSACLHRQVSRSSGLLVSLLSSIQMNQPNRVENWKTIWLSIVQQLQKFAIKFSEVWDFFENVCNKIKSKFSDKTTKRGCGLDKPSCEDKDVKGCQSHSCDEDGCNIASKTTIGFGKLLACILFFRIWN